MFYHQTSASSHYGFILSFYRNHLPDLCCLQSDLFQGRQIDDAFLYAYNHNGIVYFRLFLHLEKLL